MGFAHETDGVLKATYLCSMHTFATLTQLLVITSKYLLQSDFTLVKFLENRFLFPPVMYNSYTEHLPTTNRYMFQLPTCINLVSNIIWLLHNSVFIQLFNELPALCHVSLLPPSMFYLPLLHLCLFQGLKTHPVLVVLVHRGWRPGLCCDLNSDQTVLPTLYLSETAANVKIAADFGKGRDSYLGWI